ncbi:hypothetical protein ES703_47338 [subsurface metagenome]
MSTLVKIDNVAVEIEKASLIVENRIEERSTADFTIVDTAGTASYTKGQAVLIYDPNDVLIFGGVIDTPEIIRIAPSGELYHPITCADYHYFADKRLVAESYAKDDERTCGYIVEDIFDKYLAEEGIIIGLIELGPVVVEAIFNYVRVTDAYDALAEKAGKIWYIDENKKLYFQDRGTTLADWTITGDDIIKGSGKLSGANPKYRNRQYIRGGRATTDVQEEKFLGLDNPPNDVRYAFTIGYPIVKKPTVVVEDRAAQVVGIKGLDTTKDCYWSKGDATIVFEVAPEDGKLVTITYFGEYPILALVTDEDAITAQLATEGTGTGYVEDIADEPTLNEKDALLDSGLAKLARFGVVGQSFTFQIRRTGLKPGQLATVLYPALGLDCDMLIEAVTTRVYTGNLLYDVVAIIGPETGSWTNLFKALALMKQEVIERLNVGTDQILIILVSKVEVWGWEETIPWPPTVYPCPIVGTAEADDVATASVC